MSAVDDDAEAALTPALGLNDRGASAPPVNPLAIALSITAVAIVAGLGFVALIPRPSMVAADRLYITADQADRQAVEARFEGLVTQMRLLRLGEERDDENFGGEGVKSFPTLPEGDRTHAGAKAFGGQR